MATGRLSQVPIRVESRLLQDKIESPTGFLNKPRIQYGRTESPELSNLYACNLAVAGHPLKRLWMDS